ncbi:uncharacterized protein LOC131329705 [Rhododendron vialii]|uniref:uncharacterized protein LOC131329705 n=1 Tax=Rhododendron vialii TaxID=182163 RepID=UPI00265EF49C|nr:uncharacterized protein LOC131329705 [Rhododendron vialii]
MMRIVYCPTTSSASLTLLRAARLGFSSFLSRTTTSVVSSSHSSPSLMKYRSLSSFPSFRSIRRWSHGGGDWRSLVSLRAQIRSADPVIERFQQKVSTMGMVVLRDGEINRDTLLRAARLGFSSPLSRTTASVVSSSHSSPSLIKYRSLSSFPSFRSIRRWSHSGGDWRSPVSLRAQIRSAAPVIERFQWKVATMGYATSSIVANILKSGIIGEAATEKNIDSDRLGVFDRLVISGRTCSVSDITKLRKQHSSSKFLSFEDFNVWYAKVPKKIRKNMETFIKDPGNALYIVNNTSGTLLEHPVISFCWEKPIANYLKANTDGSHKTYPDGSTLGGAGYVIRHTSGEVVSFGFVPLSFALSGLEAEMSAFYLVVVECQRIRASHIIFESDSKQIVRVLTSSEAPKEKHAEFYRQIFGALATFEDYKVVHQYREANVVADELAEIATQVYRDPEVPDFDQLLEKAYKHEFDDCIDTPRYRINQCKKKLQELIQHC